MKKLTPIEFYDVCYSNGLKGFNRNELITYDGRTKPSTMECSKCGFLLTRSTDSFLKGGIKCPICSTGNIKTIEELLIQLNKRYVDFDDRIEIDITKFNGIMKPIPSNCKICGHKWNPKPDKLLIGQGCPKCAKYIVILKQRKSYEDVVNGLIKTHGDKFKYFEESYISTHFDLQIKCTTCDHIFHRSPKQHKMGHGCPKCKSSSKENDVGEWLDNHQIQYIRQHKYNQLIGIGGRVLRFDYYLPELNICIEFDGSQHYIYPHWFHKTLYDFEKLQKHDKLKTDYCLNNDINLIRIKYNEDINDVLTNELI